MFAEIDPEKAQCILRGLTALHQPPRRKQEQSFLAELLVHGDDSRRSLCASLRLEKLNRTSMNKLFDEINEHSDSVGCLPTQLGKRGFVHGI